MHDELETENNRGAHIEIWCGKKSESIDTAISYVDFLSARSADPEQTVEIALAAAVIPQPAGDGTTEYLLLVAADPPGVLGQYLIRNMGTFNDADGKFVADPFRVSVLIDE